MDENGVLSQLLVLVLTRSKNVSYPDEFKVPRSLKKALKERRFQIRVDQNFEEVMRRCAEIKRSHESSSWIETDMIEQYSELNRLGIAHSIEAYEAKELVGGLYGLAMGRVFFENRCFIRSPKHPRHVWLVW